MYEADTSHPCCGVYGVPLSNIFVSFIPITDSDFSVNSMSERFIFFFFHSTYCLNCHIFYFAHVLVGLTDIGMKWLLN